MPTLEKKIEHFGNELILMYDKISPIVLRENKIQQLNRSCSELSVVLMVAYFEDFLKESFIVSLNENPKRALPFVEKQLRIIDLKEFGFNLTKKMGLVIAGRINFQNPEESAKAYKLSFGIDIFNKNAIWKKKVIKFFQIRHLIVHNNAKIDMSYIKIVKCDRNKIGKKIVLSENDLIEFETILLKIAEHIQKQLG